MSNPREVQLVSRPVGWPTPENFALESRALQGDKQLAEGQGSAYATRSCRSTPTCAAV